MLRLTCRTRSSAEPQRRHLRGRDYVRRLKRLARTCRRAAVVNNAALAFAARQSAFHWSRRRNARTSDVARGVWLWPTGPTIPGGQLLRLFAGSKSVVTCGRPYKAPRPQLHHYHTVGVPDEIRHAACVGAFRDDSAPGVTVDVHDRRSGWGWFKWFLKIGGPRSKSDILLSR